MGRRVSLPAADDLFRPTASPAQSSTDEPRTEEPTSPRGDEVSAQPQGGAATPDGSRPDAGPDAGSYAGSAAMGESGQGRGNRGRRPSGRVRHDEKMTVYVTADELLDLEHARLLLRRDHGLAVDRGRLVREAVALALADLDAHGEESAIVQRLKQA